MSDTELLAERDVCLGQHGVPKPEPQLHSVRRHDFPSDDRNGRLPRRKPSVQAQPQAAFTIQLLRDTHVHLLCRP